LTYSHTDAILAEQEGYAAPSMSELSDTDPDSERVQIELLRAAGPSRRASLALGLTRTVIALSRRALRAAHPELPEPEIELLWVEFHYGREIAEGIRRYRRPPPAP
jgi:hypothetical protein